VIPISFEIGGLFLLAAILMWGTMSGFLPRFRLNGKALLLVAGAVGLIAAYQFWPEIAMQAAGIVSTPSSTSPLHSTAPAATSAPHPASIQTGRSPKTTVLREVTPQAEQSPTPGAGDDPPPPVTFDPDRDLPHRQEGKFKHGIKAIGRALHVEH